MGESSFIKVKLVKCRQVRENTCCYASCLPQRIEWQWVHLVTVNDYLAKRDSAWMAPIFEFHGLSVDCIDYHKPNSAERRKAYMADITYGTNNAFGF
ncbi:MAG: hypothetical protein CM15mP32_3960 [Flavobacteriaceae bacterium]|nr:MAG: hypothetical protein CM15mP32_3960 [Flavobacteriaceae bacterium]